MTTLSQAIAMFESGHASADDIDDAMKLGAGHPMGPLVLSDLIGPDVVQWSVESLHAETPGTVPRPAAVAAAHGERRSSRSQDRSGYGY